MFSSGCQTDYAHLPPFSENQQLQVVILTPAGSNHPQVYNAKKKAFEPAMTAGLADEIRYLPTPGNLGFIPSTAYRSGDNPEERELSVLVLGESVPTGTVQEVIPFGTMLLDVDGNMLPLVVAVPARPSEQLLRISDFVSFADRHGSVKAILENWFLHYQPEKLVRLAGWKDEKFTDNFIRKWLK